MAIGDEPGLIGTLDEGIRGLANEEDFVFGEAYLNGDPI